MHYRRNNTIVNIASFQGEPAIDPARRGAFALRLEDDLPCWAGQRGGRLAAAHALQNAAFTVPTLITNTTTGVFEKLLRRQIKVYNDVRRARGHTTRN